MIHIVAKHVVLADKIEAFKTIAKELIAETLSESGVISYALFEDTTDKNTLTFIEEWSDMDAVKSHFNTPHFTRLVPQMKPLLAEAPVINLYKKTTL